MTISSLRAALLAASLLGLGAGPALAAAPAHKVTASKAYLAFDPFMVSIVENYRVRGFLILEVTLYLPEGKDQAQAEALSPKLRDSFVRILMEYGAKVATVTRPPDLTGIAARLQGALEAALGAGSARALLTQAVIRPL